MHHIAEKPVDQLLEKPFFVLINYIKTRGGRSIKVTPDLLAATF